MSNNSRPHGQFQGRPQGQRHQDQRPRHHQSSHQQHSQQPQDMKRYAPTHFLGNLIQTFEGNLMESAGVSEVNSVIARYMEYMQTQTTEPVLHKSPLLATTRTTESQSPKSPTASAVSQSHQRKRLSNPFLDRFPDWDVDYEYYSPESYRDILAIAFMQTFDIEFNFVPIDQQYDWLKQIKFDVLTAFHKQGLYQANSYSASTDFKKSDLEDVFTTNKAIPIQMIRVFADVFGIYLFWVSSDGVLHCPSICSNPKNIVWMLVEDSNGGWNVLYPPKGSGVLYYRYMDIAPYITSVIPSPLPMNIALLNLEELQLWSRIRGIDHKKAGKTGKRNKLKEELVEELRGTTVVAQ